MFRFPQHPKASCIVAFRPRCQTAGPLGIGPEGHLLWPSGLQERKRAPHGGGALLRWGARNSQECILRVVLHKQCGQKPITSDAEVDAVPSLGVTRYVGIARDQGAAIFPLAVTVQALARIRRTVLACQVPPSLLGTRRSLSWPAICRSDRPAARAWPISRITPCSAWFSTRR